MQSAPKNIQSAPNSPFSGSFYFNINYKFIFSELGRERRLRIMDKKLPYEEPELLCYIFTDIDVITTSGNNNDIGEDTGENDGEWL